MTSFQRAFVVSALCHIALLTWVNVDHRGAQMPSAPLQATLLVAQSGVGRPPGLPADPVLLSSKGRLKAEQSRFHGRPAKKGHSSLGERHPGSLESMAHEHVPPKSELATPDPLVSAELIRAIRLAIGRHLKQHKVFADDGGVQNMVKPMDFDIEIHQGRVRQVSHDSPTVPNREKIQQLIVERIASPDISAWLAGRSLTISLRIEGDLPRAAVL